MAALLARTCLTALCVLALPAPAQDASTGVGQQTTTTQQSINTQSSWQRSQTEVSFSTHDDSDQWGHDDRRHRNRDIRDDDLFGSWTLGQENGSTCTIELRNSEWFGGYSAYVPAGCPDGFFSANRWVLSGDELLLTDTSNTVFGRFRTSGGGRWSGVRESDGARLYLNPTGR